MELNDTLVQIIATCIKIVVLFLICAHVPPFMVWFERRAPALMQRRKGPNRVGIFKFRLFGLIQPAADAIKLLFKEEVVPAAANKIFYQVAPIFGLVTSVLIAGAIPYGSDLQVFGYTIPLSIIRVDVGFLFIFAISSIGVYGITLAGWASNNKYSLMGALRASAQMISYEIPMGLSLIPMVMIFGSLDLNTIIAQQGENVFNWGFMYAPVSFFLFLICMFAETNRAPFDLAEAEGELVAGFHTEFGSFKFSLFYFGEYVSMFVLSCLAATVFFGGWQMPFIPHDQVVAMVGPNLTALITFMTLFLKAAFFMWLYVWVRWTLPRFRYDQLMSLGWKFMMPIGLVNILVTALVIAMMELK